MTTLLKSCQPGSDRVAVEVEGDRTVEIGTVDLGSGVLQAIEDFGFRKSERGLEADGDYGKTGLD